jgi:hypothetical protein
MTDRRRQRINVYRIIRAAQARTQEGLSCPAHASDNESEDSTQSITNGIDSMSGSLLQHPNHDVEQIGH